MTVFPPRKGGNYVAGVLPVRKAEIARELRNHKSDDHRDLFEGGRAAEASVQVHVTGLAKAPWHLVVK